MGCSRQLSMNSTYGVPVIRVPNFGQSPRPYLCRTLVNRLRLFPVEGVNILGPGVAKHNRRIVGGDRKPKSVIAHGGKILEVHNSFCFMVAQPNPDDGARSTAIVCLKVLAVL